MSRTGMGVLVASFGILLSPVAPGEVVLDGTLGGVGTIAGPNFVITPAQGQPAGSNLFFSFQQFSVGAGQSATFTRSGAQAAVNHVISRVTDSRESEISGALSVRFPGASFWLMNPNGIIVGPGASFDVDGALHLGGREEVEFDDGGRFHRDSGVEALSSATPMSFSGALTGSVDWFDTHQTDDARQPVDLSGDGVLVVNSSFMRTISIDAGSFEMRNSVVEAGVGENIAIKADVITLTGASRLSTSSFAGPAAGSISLQAGDVVIEKSSELSAFGAFAPGGDIDISATGDVTLDGGFVSSTSLTLNSGSVSVRGRSLTMRTNGSSIQTDTGALGNAGGIDVELAGPLFMTDGSSLSSNSFSEDGSAGSITVRASDVHLEDGASVRGKTSGSGTGASIALVASGDVRITGDGVQGTSQVSSLTTSTGTAGPIRISANGLYVDKGGFITAESQGAGAAGRVGIQVGTLGLDDHARISTQTRGLRAGDIVVNVEDAMTMGGESVITSSTVSDSGRSGDIHIATGSLLIDGGARIAATTSSSAAGGGVRVSARDGVHISGSGASGSSQIATSSSAGSSGSAGTVSISADSVFLDDGALVAAASEGSGRAGQISLSGRDILVSDGATVSVRSSGRQAGDIVIAASQRVRIQGGRIIAETDGAGDGGSLRISARNVNVEGGSLSASTTGSGRGGDISLVATDGLVVGRPGGGEASVISTASRGTRPDAGRGGDITLRARDLTLNPGARVSTESVVADGGNIKIDVSDIVLLDGAVLSTSVASGAGSGGNIDVDPVFVILFDSLIQANAFGGPGGNIRIVTDHYFADPRSRVEASSALSINGTVSIDTPDSTVDESIVVLPSDFLDAASQLAERCSSRGARSRGSFASVGRDGLAPSPVSALSGYLVAGGGAVGGHGAAKADAAPEKASRNRQAPRKVPFKRGLRPAGYVPGTFVVGCRA